MTPTFLSIPYYVWAFLCLIVALIYAVLWPRPKVGQQRAIWQHLVLRWFHSLVWILLAAACFMWATWLPGNDRLAQRLAVGGLLTYVVFMIVLQTERWRVPE
jgi:hypothetical protein